MRIPALDAPLPVRAALLCLLIFLTFPAQAVPLDSVLRQLEESSPVLANARRDLDLARAEHTGSRAWPNPRLFGGQEFIGADEEAVESAIGVEQELGFIWSQRSKVNASRYAYRAAEARFQEQLNSLAADVTIAAHDYAGIRQLKTELMSLIETARQLMAAVNARHEIGDISRYDAERFSFEIVHLQTELLGLESREQAVLNKLVELTGFDGGELAQLDTGSARTYLPDRDATVESLIARSRDTRAVLRALEHDELAARSSIGAAKAEMLPGFGLAVGQNRVESGDTGLFWEAGIELPLFGQGRSELSASRARQRSAELQLTAARARVAQEIRGAHQKYLRVNETATAPADSLIQRARQNVDRGSSLYVEGELSVFELVDVLNSSYEAEAAAISLRNAAIASEIELARAVGIQLMENDND